MSVEVGDVCRYANGNEYVITDGGPSFVASCFLCGATACATGDVPARSVRCGECWARQAELLPGQRMFEAKRQWQAEHKMPTWRRGG